MAGPFIFIGTHRIREGKLEDLRRGMVEFCRFVEEREPQLIAFNMYLDEEGQEITAVQVHPDVRSMQGHMQVVHKHIENAYTDTLEKTTSIQIYGEVSDDALAMMKSLSGADVAYIVKTDFLAGFTRSAASERPAPA